METEGKEGGRVGGRRGGRGSKLKQGEKDIMGAETGDYIDPCNLSCISCVSFTRHLLLLLLLFPLHLSICLSVCQSLSQLEGSWKYKQDAVMSDRKSPSHLLPGLQP